MLFSLTFIIIYLYDPLQIFYSPLKKETKFHKIGGMRKQAVGIIRNVNFESVIIGTSILQNTSSQKASSLFNQKFVNLSMSGSNYDTRSHVLNFLLAHKNIKTIIYSLDYIEAYHQKSDAFNYLYDNNPFNDFKTYINQKYLSCMITWSKSANCIGHIVNLDRPYYWNSNDYGIDKWVKNRSKTQLKRVFKQVNDAVITIQNNKVKKLNITSLKTRIENQNNYIDNYLFSFIEKYPNVKFILVFPPNFIAKYALMKQVKPDKFHMYSQQLKYVISKLKQYKNFEIYGFDNEAFCQNIDNYKDLDHFKEYYNTWMLQQIRNKKHQLNIDNIDSYISLLSQKASQYDLIRLSYQLGK